MPEKSGFYETVTEVNSNLHFFWVGLLFFSSVATHVVLHRVSIRTLFEPFLALCLLGFSRRSRCCQFSAGLVKAQRDTQSSEHGVVATVENDSCPKRPLHKTERMAAV